MESETHTPKKNPSQKSKPLPMIAAELAAMLRADIMGHPTPTSVVIARVGATLGLCRPGDRTDTILAALDLTSKGLKPRMSSIISPKEAGQALREWDCLDAIEDGARIEDEIRFRTKFTLKTIRPIVDSLLARGIISRNSDEQLFIC